jgi:starvation-inducible DNA-binding protein
MNNNQYNNYYQEMVNLLNQYLSNIAVLIVNLYNYHWNVVGPDFFPMHEKLQEYYEELTEIYDEVAERIKQLGGYPVASLNQYEGMAQIKTVASKDYYSKEIITNLIRDFEYMVNITNQLIEIADQANDEVSIVLLGDYGAFFQKQLWMLNANQL